MGSSLSFNLFETCNVFPGNGDSSIGLLAPIITASATTTKRRKSTRCLGFQKLEVCSLELIYLHLAFRQPECGILQLICLPLLVLSFQLLDEPLQTRKELTYDFFEKVSCRFLTFCRVEFHVGVGIDALVSLNEYLSDK